MSKRAFLRTGRFFISERRWHYDSFARIACLNGFFFARNAPKNANGDFPRPAFRPIRQDFLSTVLLIPKNRIPGDPAALQDAQFPAPVLGKIETVHLDLGRDQRG